MTERSDPELLLALRQERRAREAEERELAARVRAAVERAGAGRDTFDPLVLALVSRELDRIYDEFYGRVHGDRAARWRQLIVRMSALAYARPFAREAKDVARRLKRFPAVLRAIRAEVG